MSIYELNNVRLDRDREDGYSLLVEDLKIEPGEHIAITGPSGCGKSTTLDLLGMILSPTASEHFFFNCDKQPWNVTDLWKKKHLDRMATLRCRHIGYVLQTGELLPFLTVRDNIALTARLKGIPNIEDRVGTLMDALEISHLSAQLPASLSIGERQRVAIGRALAPCPDVILADEPTAALDPLLARKVMRLFLNSVEKENTALILVSHDLNLVREFGFCERPISVKESEQGLTAVLGERQ